MNSDELKGKAKEVVGVGQQKLGELTDNHGTQAKGLLKQAEGKLQEGFGKLKDAAHHAGDKVEQEVHKLRHENDTP